MSARVGIGESAYEKHLERYNRQQYEESLVAAGWAKMYETERQHLVARRSSRSHWNTTPEKNRTLDKITSIVGEWDSDTKPPEPTEQIKEAPEDTPPPNEELLKLLNECEVFDVEFRH